MKLVIGSDLHPDLITTFRSINDALDELGGLAAYPDVVVAVGAAEPEEPCGAKPLVVVPLGGTRGLGAPTSRALERADCVAPLAAEDLLGLPRPPWGRPVTVLGVPRPAFVPVGGTSLDVLDAPPELRESAARRWPPTDISERGVGVSWVGGWGGWSVARAAAAAERGHAVITLPSVLGPTRALDGAALATLRPLEVIDATELLLGSPPLTRALVAACRRRVAALPSARLVALRLLEAAHLARERRCSHLNGAPGLRSASTAKLSR